MSDTKVYRATLSLGKSTDTYDASGKILEEKRSWTNIKSTSY